jgi:hypothetical protein
MNYLHVGIIEASQECLASHTEEGLRQQVTDSLSTRSIAAFTDEEWADCVKGEFNSHVEINCLPFGVITYYKIESRLGESVGSDNGNVHRTA